jgi:acetyl-CoA carboxylase biotin carboxyl carrier protein
MTLRSGTFGESMELREIKALLALMREFELKELEIEDKRGKVRLVRSSAAPDGYSPAAPAPAAAAQRAAPYATGIPAPSAAQGHIVSAPQARPAPELGPGQRLVQSPMVGTFYRSPSPGGPPFVEEGDAVRKGQPLCIIEAMKMMNEIEAELAGKIVKILCDNGQPVEYGQPMMVIEAA